MNLILLGAPGAGKGTQAEKIVAKYNIPSISTGNIIREAINNSTEMGIKAKAYTESGQLVPDDVVIGIIKDRLKEDDCKDGFILDGFPRTIPQAQALKDMGVKIDLVIDIEVDDDTVIKRLSGRRVCSKCSTPYHIIYNKPKKDGICDLCGGELIQRKDDEINTVEARLNEYHALTEPLKYFYEKEGILKIVQGQDKLEKTSAKVFSYIEGIEN